LPLFWMFQRFDNGVRQFPIRFFFTADFFRAPPTPHIQGKPFGRADKMWSLIYLCMYFGCWYVVARLTVSSAQSRCPLTVCPPLLWPVACTTPGRIPYQRLLDRKRPLLRGPSDFETQILAKNSRFRMRFPFAVPHL